MHSLIKISLDWEGGRGHQRLPPRRLLQSSIIGGKKGTSFIKDHATSATQIPTPYSTSRVFQSLSYVTHLRVSRISLAGDRARNNMGLKTLTWSVPILPAEARNNCWVWCLWESCLLCTEAFEAMHGHHRPQRVAANLYKKIKNTFQRLTFPSPMSVIWKIA